MSVEPTAVTAREEFLALLDTSVVQNTLVKLLLSKYQGEETELQRLTIRPVTVKGQACLSFVSTYKTRDITKNLPVAEALAHIASLLPAAFRNAHLLSLTEDVQLTFGKKDKARLFVGKVVEREAPVAGHDREKKRFLELSRPFLTDLGVTTARHELVPAMARKWKQINRFVEIVSQALARTPLLQPRAEPVRVVDFGAGRAYLTFALHDWLAQQGLALDVRGIEQRADLVAEGHRIVQGLGLQGLRMVQGDVGERHYHPAALNVMIALHACDVATDYAIHLGIRSGADIIMCSPCCHKQIRPQLLSPHPLRPILQHGIHLGQEAEMLTDGLRALLLDAAGYDTQVFEFISLEHTNKNKMILAVKRPEPVAPIELLEKIRGIKQFYGLQEHCLETLLQADGRF